MCETFEVCLVLKDYESKFFKKTKEIFENWIWKVFL